MILMPDPSTAIIDPFFEETTLDLRCDIVEPSTMQGYERCPRSLAKRAEAYLKSTGTADSFFDIWLTVTVPGPDGQPITLVAESTKHMRSLITHKPPGPGDVYESPQTVRLH